MQQDQNILPIARKFEENENFDWQINRETGISCDYANEFGLTVLFMIQARIEHSEENKVPIQQEDIKNSLYSYLERVRILTNYSEFMRKKIDARNAMKTKQYEIGDFICNENLERVRSLEDLAGKIREVAQPAEGIEADLTRVLELAVQAKQVIDGKQEEITKGEIANFVELFCKFGIQVK